MVAIAKHCTCGNKIDEYFIIKNEVFFFLTSIYIEIIFINPALFTTLAFSTLPALLAPSSSNLRSLQHSPTHPALSAPLSPHNHPIRCVLYSKIIYMYTMSTFCTFSSYCFHMLSSFRIHMSILCYMCLLHHMFCLHSKYLLYSHIVSLL